MTSLADKILANVRACGDCLLWTGGLNSSGCPVCRHEGSNADPVRRHIWKAMGRKLDSRAIVSSCKEDLCVAPEHLVQGNRGPKLGSRKTIVARVNMAKARRARSTLTVDQVNEIRMSDEIPRVLGERFGKSQSQIRNIKSGADWGPIATPWAGLGDRT